MSIYEKIIREEINLGTAEYEKEVLNGRKVPRKSSKDLNTWILKFYERDYRSIEEICKFFENNRALEIIEEFERFIYSLEIFEEKKLSGLSILLMRDTETVEAIKFGILLANYYPLVNYEKAVRMIVDLGTCEEFTYYSLKTLKQLNYYEVVRDNILRRTTSKGREIGEKIK